MKKSVFKYVSSGSKFIDLEILLDINRNLTENDNNSLREHVENIAKSLNEETIRLDPKSKEFANKEKTDIISLFGDRAIYVEEIPNGYCSEYCCKHLPWFIITTNKGRIKIGWRKRVIEINWDDSIIIENAEFLFPNEDVTKFDKTIHAWELEKAKQYIDLILS
jgi:hypothetical protein